MGFWDSFWLSSVGAFGLSQTHPPQMPGYEAPCSLCFEVHSLMELWTILHLVRLWFISTENLLWLLSNMYSLWLWYAVFKLTRAMQMDKCSIIEFHSFGGTFKFFYHPIHKCFEGRILTHIWGGWVNGDPSLRLSFFPLVSYPIFHTFVKSNNWKQNPLLCEL